MSNFTLTSQTSLNGASYNSNGISVSELTQFSLVSIAYSKKKNQLAKDIETSFKTTLPKIGQTTSSDIDNARFLGMQIDQYFVLFNERRENAVNHIAEKINSSAYLCDQSDSWVILNISGQNTQLALERICSIDLHLTTFPVGAVARTMMEHLAVIILREEEHSFLLFSPRSSADSFSHAVLTSINNIF